MAEGHTRSGKAPGSVGTMSQEQRELHSLNRLTFGPRPEDLAHVRQIGLDAWFEQQLHPERIDDADLAARLARFPAMQLSPAALLARFPSPQELRRYREGTLPPPQDAAGRAIYADASLRYEQKRAAKLTKNPTSPQTAIAETVDPALAPAAMDPAVVQSILEFPPAERFERLIRLTPEEMQSLRATLKGNGEQRLAAGLAPVQVEQVAAMQSPERVVGTEILSARLLRDVYSERQLQAVMTDFWLNHFNVYIRKNGNEPYLLPAYERETILPHALGRFEDLLVATAQSPAMLVYLDNAASVGPNSRAAQRTRPSETPSPEVPGKTASPRVQPLGKVPKGINENYARELMELHTLGVNGGYTQQDVIEVAKCFTGWSIDRSNGSDSYVFNPNRHEPGSKTVLGQVIPESGEGEGLAVLHLLATRPATAHFLSLKLAQRFVSDNPSPALVNRMSTAYLSSDGDIATVLRTMFHSREFWSPAIYRAKVKTPLEFVTSAMRAGAGEVRNPVPLTAALARLGMPLYGMQTPNGYGWLAPDWVSSNALLTRMNFALVLAGNRLPGTHLAWAELVGGEAGTDALQEAKAEQQLERLLLGQPAVPQTRTAVLQQAKDPSAQRTAQQGFASVTTKPDEKSTGLGESESLLHAEAQRARVKDEPETPLDTMAGLLLGSPDFQRR